MSKLSRDVLISTAAKQVEAAERYLEEAQRQFQTLQHTNPLLAPLLRVIVSAQIELAGACSRVLDLVRDAT